MLIIGSHVKFDKNNQLVKSVKEAISYNANAFMFYTGAPQNTLRGEINPDLTKEALELMKKNKIEQNNIIVHAPYIVNLGNRLDESKFQFSVNFLITELKRVEACGAKYVVLHPGSHVGAGMEEGIKNIIAGLNLILEKDETNVTILLETMAGKGSEVGSKFEEIKVIIDGVQKNKRIGVCIDTCHLNDSGYDIKDFDKVLDEFDKIIGIDKIKCIHVNDSKNISSSHKDRHANIGFGEIGFQTLMRVVYSERLKDVPRILETPYVNDFAPYKQEIAMIRDNKFDSDLLNKIQEEKI